VCDLETSRMRRPWPALGPAPQEKKKLWVPLVLLLHRCRYSKLKQKLL
jgi:hypothetical protein